MNDSESTKERNPNTHNTHKKQVFWQITFPLILGLLVVLALGVWAVLSAVQGDGVSQSADASLVFLLMPVMVMTLIPFVLLTGLAYGVILLNKNLPAAMYKVQQVMVKIRDGVIKGAGKAVEPVLRIRSTTAALQYLRNKTKKS
jgi:hypothetical protein